MIESEENIEDNELARSGRCVILGRPNAGKSTLLNALLNQKLVAATDKPGTTRVSVLGVYMDDIPTQIAFVDTPGLHRPKSALGQILKEQAMLGTSEADVAILLIDVSANQKEHKINTQDIKALELIKDQNIPVILAINKIDLLKDKSQLLPLIDQYQKHFNFSAYVPISAKKKLLFPELIKEIRKHLSKGLLYPEDILTDKSERFLASELIREAAVRHNYKEIPHGLACYIDKFSREGDMIHILATLIVEKDSHKSIVIGSQGNQIKKISTEARKTLEDFLDSKVFLKLWVRVEKNWTANPIKSRTLTLEDES